ncbi:helix-turn-helix transcriptional regulator [Sphingopyxis sp. R3-92]|uniref:AraC family transcriptional regulator n=1 Tax=Sphingopyxis sp. R3-92 TaxID=3158553 RepID=UPI003EE73243
MDRSALARVEDSRRSDAGERSATPLSLRRADPRRLAKGTAQIVETSAGGLLSRYHVHVDDLIVDLRHAPRCLSSELHVPRGRVLFLVPLDGAVLVSHGEEHVICPVGTPWVGTGPSQVFVSWQDCANMLAVYFYPERLNASVSSITGDGRRLAPAATSLAPLADTCRLVRVTELIVDLIGTSQPQSGAATTAVAASFYQGLAEHLCGSASELMQPVRAVSDAIRLVRDKPQTAFDLEQLAAAVGVTGGTLRKGFRACLGMTVKEYIRSMRLSWAHERLESGMESRSVAELAIAAGFADTPSFSRAFLRRYSESASQTRARAVRQRE